jgi:hypothetical protein
MKIGWYIGFGLGLAAGALILHNSKRAQRVVSDAQDAVIEKAESAKDAISMRMKGRARHGSDSDGWLARDSYGTDSHYAARGNMDPAFSQSASASAQ